MDGSKLNPTTLWPSLDDVPGWTDKYFRRTREVVLRFGDSQVTYAVFMRRPVLYAAALACEWLKSMGEKRGETFDIEERFREGDWVGAGEPMMYIRGSFAALVDLETLFLQKLGAACVAAYNAHAMCEELPQVAFLAMDGPPLRWH